MVLPTTEKGNLATTMPPMTPRKNKRSKNVVWISLSTAGVAELGTIQVQNVSERRKVIRMRLPLIIKWVAAPFIVLNVTKNDRQARMSGLTI